MLDRGFRSDGLVTVQGNSSNSCLIMVAEPGGRGDATAGIWFGGGIRSNNVPLVLVSDGAVRIEDAGGNDSAAGVSIYANGVSILGPLFVDGNGDLLADHVLRLSYGLSHLLNPLRQQGLLPGPGPGALSEFPMVAGSWRELPPGN
jgi:hypothetical protein